VVLTTNQTGLTDTDHAVADLIVSDRGLKVIVDGDLAAIYGVPTKRLNEQVKRNAHRFPSDFAFRLAPEEATHLKSQNATSSALRVQAQVVAVPTHGGRRKLPLVFTEHGAIMAANVLNSARAILMSVFVVRAFVKMREQLLNRAEMEKRLADIETVLLSHDTALQDLYRKLKPLLLPPPAPPRLPIGFHVREPRMRYSTRRTTPTG